jgi:hypothetical protein
MAFLLNTLSIPVRRVVFCGFVATVGCVAAAASEATAARPPRAERIATRRLERIDVLERRAEAAAEMPPRPADVRRLLRRGVPLSEIMPPVGRGRPAATAARATTPTPQAAAATTAQAQPATPPRPFATAPATAAAPPAAAEPPLRFPEQPATAIDDGTRSVLVREEPTPAPPAELLPTPQAKD